MFRRFVSAIEAAALVATLSLVPVSGTVLNPRAGGLLVPAAEAWDWDWLPRPHFDRAIVQDDGTVTCTSWGVSCIWWD